MTTNIKEEGLETLIIKYLVEKNGYEQGTNDDYNRDYAIDETRLFLFLKKTQPQQMKKLQIEESALKREQFLSRLIGEITKRGVIDVLRNGIKIYPANLVMLYLTPSEKNPKAQELFNQNIFSVTRQLMYSNDHTRLALDLCIFINGLPVITMELKNQFTGQNVENAVNQYKVDRDAREHLFNFKRCMVHFAVDDNQVKFCTKIEGNASWFLPFNKGYKDGAGNPPNTKGIKTDYLWKEILTKLELLNIIENYAQVVKEKNLETGKTKETQIFPRFHQLSVVKMLLEDAKLNGPGQRYLIQHSAGSGKSNSIAWLAYQLVGLERAGQKIFDSVIVVTDRVNLDSQIKNTIKNFMQVNNTMGHADHSSDLRKLLFEGKRIIITTVQKFPFILDGIGDEFKNRNFAIIIDEAHSSTTGKVSAKMNMVLSGKMKVSEDKASYGEPEEVDVEDKINQIIEGRKMLKNASYFAFTATPKNKTLEMFGTPYVDEDITKHRPFHVYTMKQAIQEKFILDVLENYTTIDSYYKIAKKVKDNPEFDADRAQKKLRAFVECQEVAIRRKAVIMVDHFHDHVAGKGKIVGKARAMVITSGIERAIDYYYAFNDLLKVRKSPYKALVAFSGTKDYHGKKLDESTINGFPGRDLPRVFKEDPYRFLIVADKYQTGYDEPLLHTMYVDKTLGGVKAVQTLSRLNRSCPGKYDSFILDFANSTEEIKDSFEPYFRTTKLSSETDPNKLYDLIQVMEKFEVYNDFNVNTIVELFLNNADRDKLDPILDYCADIYSSLEEFSKIEFKGAAKNFVRTYGFLASILPYGDGDWEKLSIFLNLLIPKLPSPQGEDFAGLLDSIDLDSYRLEIQKTTDIKLEDEDTEIPPVPIGNGKGLPDPNMDTLDHIINEFNDLFGNIDWKYSDRIREDLKRMPEHIIKDEKYRNAVQNSDKQNAHLEYESALVNVLFNFMADNIELYKQFNDNSEFKKWLSDEMFEVTYRKLKDSSNII